MMEYPAVFLEQQLVTTSLSPMINGQPKDEFAFVDVLEKDEKLCEYYRRMPVLYDKSHPHYKFQSKKEKAWRELSRLCEMNVDQCKKRMTYFRCRFTVERRIMKNGVNCSEWPLLDKLKFLNKHIKIRRPRAPNGDVEPDTDDESNPLAALRKRQMEDAKDDLHAYLDLQQMAAAQNPQAQLHYQVQQAKLQQQYPHAQHQGYHPGQDMGMHHLQSQHGPGQPGVHPGANHHGHRGDGHHPGQLGPNPLSVQAMRPNLSQPTPAESPIPASNVEASYNVPKRQRLNFDMDEAVSVSNYNLNRTVKYQNNMDHSVNLDEHGAFGLYVGEILRKLPERLGSVTSLKIMQLVHEAQIQSLDMASTANNNNANSNSSNAKKDSSANSSVGSEERKSTESNESANKE
ncbi:transcription factor mef2A-like isoform X2 [Ochlerotatus camptorhynchus]|uniref:transcription factor mef2A-like isoform X2 n=1 Tax=Ochlerotatus camptorhynchus TaxID=644619 RepID=UPI0031E37EAA